METAREKNLTISNLRSNNWRSWLNRGFKRLFDVFGLPSSTAVRAPGLKIIAQDAPAGRRTRFDHEQERRVEWEG